MMTTSAGKWFQVDWENVQVKRAIMWPIFTIAFRLATFSFTRLTILSARGLSAQSPPAAVQEDRSTSADFDALRSQLASPDPNVRAAAVEQISGLGTQAKGAIPKLVELLGDRAPAKSGGSTIELHYIVRRALVRLGPTVTDDVIAGLAHKNRHVRIGAAEVLGGLRATSAVEPLIKTLADQDQEVAGHASTALVLIGQAAMDPVIDALADSNSSARAMAANTLGNMRNSKVVEPLGRRLFDSDEKVRDCAAYALQTLAGSGELGTVWRASDEIVDPIAAAKARAATDAALRRLAIEQLSNALASDHSVAQLAAVKSARFVMAPELTAGLAGCIKAEDAKLRLETAQALSVINDPNVFPPLLIALHDADANVRAAAANGLRFRIDVYNEHNPRAELVEPLVAATSDPEARVRQSVAEALGRLNQVKPLPGDKKSTVVAALIRLLQDDEANVASAAIDSLATLGDRRAVEPMIGLLENAALGTKAVVALARFHDQRAVKPLRAKLDQKDAQVIAALGQMRDRDSVDALIALLDDTDDHIRQAAAQALGAIRDPQAVEPLIDHLTKNHQVVHDVARALGEIKDPRAIGPLIDAARVEANRIELGFRQGKRESIDNPVAWPLNHMGIPAIEPLAGALCDPSDDVREVAAWALSSLCYPDEIDQEDMEPAREALRLALADRSEFVQGYAAMTLARWGDGHGIDVLLSAVAKGDERSLVFMNAPASFGALLEPRSVTPLIELLSDIRPAVRATAAQSLGAMDYDRAVEPLIAALGDKDARVRAAAAGALGHLKAHKAFNSLVGLLTDEDPTVRIAAVDSLADLDDARAIPSLAELASTMPLQMRIAANIALMRLNDPGGLDGVELCLRDPDAKLREDAATALLNSGYRSERLLKPLIELLDDSNPRVQGPAVYMLGAIGSRPAIDALLGKTADRNLLPMIVRTRIESNDERWLAMLVQQLDDDDPKIRTLSATAVARIGSENGVAPLVKHLTDQSPEVRVAIVDALKKLGSKDSLAALKAALGDPELDVRIHAVRAVARIER